MEVTPDEMVLRSEDRHEVDRFISHGARPHRSHGRFSIIQLGQVNDTASDIRDNWMPSMRAASAMRFQAANYRLKENRHISTESTQKTTAEQEAAEARKQFEPGSGL